MRVLHQQKQKQQRQPLVLVLVFHLMLSLFFLTGVSVSAFTASTITSSFAPSTIRTAGRKAITSREGSQIIKKTTTTTTTTTTTRKRNNKHDNRLVISLSSQDDADDTSSRTIIDTTNLQVKKQESTSNSNPITSVGIPQFLYTIRDCTYTELKQVATLTVNGFYDTTKMNRMSQKLTELAELNRLQQTYSYEYDNNENHRMLIMVATPITRDTLPAPATATKELIVGYMDVDVRPCELKIKLPRPYISDVVVDINHRRQGLARKLVKEGEHFIVKTTQQKKKENNNPDLFTPTYTDVWIRVEETNIAAIELYQNQLGYVNIDWCTSTGSYSEITRNNTIDNDTNTAENDTVRTNVTSDNNDVSTFMNTVAKSISTFKGKETPNILTLRKRIESNRIESI